MRTVGIIFLLVAGGFLIYGATLPNNPPDLIVGGALAMGGLALCLIIGAVFLVVSFLTKNSGRDS